MSEKELQALIALLDDPDMQVFEVVQEKLLSGGTEIVPTLEKVWENSLNINLHRRIENIIHQIQFSNTKINLEQWVKDGGNNLLEGACLVARYQYPELKFEDIEERIGIIKNDLNREIISNLTPLQKIKTINHIFFDIHKFTRNTGNYFSPQNCFVNQVLESKKANPISMAIVYCFLANSLDLPVFGVNLPFNFILAFLHDTHKPIQNVEEEEILFYINPYNNGAVLGKREIDLFLKQQKLDWKKSYYLPCNNIETIARLISTLVNAYGQIGQPDKIMEMEELLQIVEKQLTNTSSI